MTTLFSRRVRMLASSAAQLLPADKSSLAEQGLARVLRAALLATTLIAPPLHAGGVTPGLPLVVREGLEGPERGLLPPGAWVVDEGGRGNEFGGGGLGVLLNGNLVVATENQLTPNQLPHPALSTFAPTGLPLESHLYAGDSTDSLGRFIITPDGNMLVAGATSSFGFTHGAGWAFETSPSGEILWQRAYTARGAPGNEFTTATPIPTGGFYLVGDFGTPSSEGGGGGAIWIVRIDGNGNVLSSATYEAEAAFHPDRAILRSNGDLLIAGADQGNNTQDTLLDINAAGAVAWKKEFPTGGFAGLAVVETLDGGILVGTNILTHDPMSPIGTNVTIQALLVRFDATGKYLWSSMYGDASFYNSFGGSMLALPDGTFLIPGTTSVPALVSPIVEATGFVLHVSATGEILSQLGLSGNSYPSTGIDDIARASDGSIFVSFSVGGLTVTNVTETSSSRLGLARLSVRSTLVGTCRSTREVSSLRATRRALTVRDGSTTTASITTTAVPTTASDTILPLRVTAVCGHPQQP